MKATTPTPAESLENIRKARLKMINRRIRKAADLLEEAAFILQIDHPEGGIFIEGEGSINALQQRDDEKGTREHGILASARFEKSLISVGAW